MSTRPPPIRVLTPDEAHVLVRILKAPPKPLSLEDIRQLAAPTPIDEAFDFILASNLVEVPVNRRTARPERGTYIPTANATPTLLEHFEDICHEIGARASMCRVKPEIQRLAAIKDELTDWFRKSTPQSTDLNEVRKDKPEIQPMLNVRPKPAARSNVKPPPPRKNVPARAEKSERKEVDHGKEERHKEGLLSPRSGPPQRRTSR